MSTSRGLALLAVPVTCAGLGTWQVQRKEEKESLIASLEGQLRSSPVELPPSAESDCDDKGMWYKPVVVTGRFDHSREILLGPRTLNRDMFSSSGGGGAGGVESSGFQVITPFVRSGDSNERILVNRGWVPASLKSPPARPGGQVEGEIALSGIFRGSESGNSFTPANDPRRGHWHRVDVREMASATGAAPVMIDARADATPPGGHPVAGQTMITVHNQHLSYIITWYGLSAATFMMWLKMAK